MANEFIIGTDDFGVGKVILNIDKDKLLLIELIIIGDEQTFEDISEVEDGVWSFALYPPKLYFNCIPFKYENEKIEIIITSELIDNYDVALYLMSHNDIEGTLTIDSNDVLTFVGFTFISGKKINLEVEINLKDNLHTA